MIARRKEFSSSGEASASCPFVHVGRIGLSRSVGSRYDKVNSEAEPRDVVVDPQWYIEWM